jgi:hypothetical protein
MLVVHRWLIPVILATRRQRLGQWRLEANLGKYSQDSIFKKTKTKTKNLLRIKQPKVKHTHSGHTLRYPFECQIKY